MANSEAASGVKPTPKTWAEKVLANWEKYCTLPLAALALVYLALYAIEVLGHWSAALILDFVTVSDAIWLVFIVDFAVRFTLSHGRIAFLKNNVIEMISLVLPLFRALRMFRVVVALGFIARVAQSLQARIGVYLGLILPMLIFVCSLGVYDAEHQVSGANITSFGNAVWWAFVTVTTIGYGDFYPVTFEGRAIAVLLMLSGIALVSVVTVTFASWFLTRLEYDLTAKGIVKRISNSEKEN